ncbi:FAD-binding oxidoreductase [Chryseobacterium indologenes]|uniref:NAD(P)/FAD-dependent oxidoreductase n=1 Tax=Chryseobacterium indologenes TaxID=253 RepID=UPI000F506082|nr:FAD-binding oxidoreductase [Chryseobacterium indologenes]AYZ36795.1 FAD-binding oxidoreductase [Chryseobacterium indologenes]MBF6645582.1 FAD-binding oxidoreductase [Chryseobacterium indologenes]MBU3046895.1 FAD-binding oxidoreductase [Chryseobacterium indologenes]MEB4760119.1 FAD-binding oxidoreductase [Chryseobacterium indologenes]QQQ70746.1 FAD-binding oxidoreductase [Chryseobacterium indologenes]
MDLKSNEPFWLLKNGLIASYPSLKADEECDVLIIGGGITGSLIAHQMIKDGYHTILIDRRELCNGSTSATTSMLQYEIDVPLFELIEKIGKKGAIESYKACSDAIDRVEKLAGLIKSDAGFKRKKSLYFASKKKDTEWLQKEYQARRDAGFDVKWLKSEQVLKQFGFENTYGGILSKQGASIDAFRFAHELFRHNVKKGLRIFDKTEMVKVQYHKGFNLVSTDKGYQIKTKKIIYCIGYESKNLIKENFVDLKSTYAVVSEIDNDKFKNISNTLVWNTDDPYIYMRTTDDGRLLIGGGDEDFYDAEKRDSLLEKKEKEIIKSLKKIKPDYHFYPDFVWAGTFGETKDGLPYIGEHEKFKNSYFVLGFGGNGITFSATGMEMTSLFMKNKKHLLSKYFKFGR